MSPSSSWRTITVAEKSGRIKSPLRARDKTQYFLVFNRKYKGPLIPKPHVPNTQTHTNNYLPKNTTQSHGGFPEVPVKLFVDNIETLKRDDTTSEGLLHGKVKKRTRHVGLHLR